jgi:hypothetical protein
MRAGGERDVIDEQAIGFCRASEGRQQYPCKPTQNRIVDSRAGV